jgi:hypothetical protein
MSPEGKRPYLGPAGLCSTDDWEADQRAIDAESYVEEEYEEPQENAEPAKPDTIRVFSESLRGVIEQRAAILLRSVPEKVAVKNYITLIAQAFGEETVGKLNYPERTYCHYNLRLVDPNTSLVYSIESFRSSLNTAHNHIVIDTLEDELKEDLENGIYIYPTEEFHLAFPRVVIGKEALNGKFRQRKAAAKYLPEYAKDPKGVNRDIKNHCQRIWELAREKYFTPPQAV